MTYNSTLYSIAVAEELTVLCLDWLVDSVDSESNPETDEGMLSPVVEL